MSKLALVIGNNAYQDGNTLTCCENDSEDMANQLHRIGFQVTHHTNKNYTNMLMLIKQFTERIKEDDLVVLSYSGHGRELEDDNYLIPTDNVCLSEYPDIHFLHSISVNWTIHTMMPRKPFAIIVFLDCCRLSIHIPSHSRAIMSKTDFTTRPKNEAKAGYLIAFACGPNGAAIDRSPNQRNGFFTYRLLQYLTVPNLKLEEILRNADYELSKYSDESLRIHQYSELRTAEIYLNRVEEGSINGNIIYGKCRKTFTMTKSERESS